MKNWKTSTAGIALIMTAVAGVLTSISSGAPVDWGTAAAAIIGGIMGLMSKDYDVTGGIR
jgi:hypothetical protein